MSSYDEVTAAVYETLANRETVIVMEDEAKEVLGFLKSQFCLIIHTEYLGSDGTGQDITFNLILPKSFPLVLPKIYIDCSQVEKYRYLPHVNVTSGHICTFDEETTRPDPKNPVGVVLDCVKRAKQIIEDGLRGANFKDYEDEFMTYWMNSYDDEPKILADTLCLFSAEPDATKLEMIKLSKKVATFEYVLHQNDDDAKRFLKYLEDKAITHTITTVCHLGRIPFDFKPPFSRRNKDIKRMVATLPAQVSTKFKSYINSKSSPKNVTASVTVNGEQHLIGWRHTEFKPVGKRNGFRKGKTNNFELLSSLQATDFVNRCHFMVLSTLQKQMRTDGITAKQPRRKLLVAGLGSIGSNLIQFLNSDTSTEFMLVDPDYLTLDNLNRHFLGFESLWKYKAKAMHDYLLYKNPLQKVTYFEATIDSFFEHGRKLIEEMDYLFLVTGKANVDEYMSAKCRADEMNKPLFILWVEPYLSAGHCLYLHPDDRGYLEFFDQDDFFKNNVIEKAAYMENHPLLSLKQSGCHTSYVPYGLNAVAQFLSAIFPEVNAILNQSIKTSKAITWIGDLQQITELGIAVKNNMIELKHGSLIIDENGTI